MSPSAFARHEQSTTTAKLDSKPTIQGSPRCLGSHRGRFAKKRYNGPASDLGSVQFQATVNIQEILAALAAEADDTLLNYDDALELMDWALDQTFAPQRQSRKHSSAGHAGDHRSSNFSHLWVCGMSAEQFPGKSKHVAVFPDGVALSHGMPRCQLQELEFAERTLTSWIQSNTNTSIEFHQYTQRCPRAPDATDNPDPDNRAGRLNTCPIQSKPASPFHATSRHQTDVTRGFPEPYRCQAGQRRQQPLGKPCQMRLYGLRLASLRAATSDSCQRLLNAMERGNALHWVMGSNKALP